MARDARHRVRAICRALAPLALAVAVSCGGSSGAPPSSFSPIPIGPGTGSPSPHVLTHLVIDQVFEGGSYTGGSKSFVRITGENYRRTLGVPSVGSRLLDLKRPGAFTIRSYQQQCRATCARLRTPTDACGRSFSATGVLVRVLITVTPGQGCTITLS